MARRNAFLRNGRGVFKCYTCTRSCRQTKETGDSECCMYCYELAGYENQCSDEGGLDESAQKQVASLIADCVKAGGDRETIRKSFDLGGAQ